jgi:hypothetical protein
VKRAAGIAFALVLSIAPAAHASRVSGFLEYCTGGDECRYFPDPRLNVSFVAGDGERNAPTVKNLIFEDPGSTITAGSRCKSETPNRAVCDSTGAGTWLISIDTGDEADVARPADSVPYYLGPGEDIGEGTALSDQFAGGDDHDELTGDAGFDTLEGNGGEDLVDGGGGGDSLSGGTGADRLLGGGGDDDLEGGRGPDRLVGGSGGDGLAGGSGNDRLIGGSGRDILNGRGGRDVIDAGSGNDRVRARDGRRDRIRCGRGFDRVTADRFDRLRGCERVRRPK